MITRNLGFKISGNEIKKLKEENIEKQVKSQVKLRKAFKMLLTITGIGDILGLTIMLEVDDINRFPKVGDYSSYCRCVKSERLSRGRKT